MEYIVLFVFVVSLVGSIICTVMYNKKEGKDTISISNKCKLVYQYDSINVDDILVNVNGYSYREDELREKGHVISVPVSVYLDNSISIDINGELYTCNVNCVKVKSLVWYYNNEDFLPYRISNDTLDISLLKGIATYEDGTVKELYATTASIKETELGVNVVVQCGSVTFVWNTYVG